MNFTQIKILAAIVNKIAGILTAQKVYDFYCEKLKTVRQSCESWPLQL